MRKETVNGRRVPYGLPIDELERMMGSSDMGDFSLACEALSCSDSPEAYEIMRRYLEHKDKYRRLYVMKTIFRRPEAAELVNYLERAILSDDELFWDNGLSIIAEHNVKVSEDAILSAVEKHLPRSYHHTLQALAVLSVSEENYARLARLFGDTKLCCQKAVIADIMAEKYLPGKASELYRIFAEDGFAEIRLRALGVAEEFGLDTRDLIEKIDSVAKNLPKSKFPFLAEYSASMRIDLSDDLESAIVYNPHGGENLSAVYDPADEYSPYMLAFSTQHVHLRDAEEAEAWAKGIIQGEICALEFFRDGRDCFGGEITTDELRKLSYESLEGSDFHCFPKPLFAIADSFRIRSWNGENDIDGRIFEKNGKGEIEISHV